MGLIEDLNDATTYRPVHGPKCSMCRTMTALTPAEAAALQAALDNPTVLGTAISEKLRKNGHDVKPMSVQRHRRGECYGTR